MPKIWNKNTAQSELESYLESFPITKFGVSLYEDVEVFVKCLRSKRLMPNSPRRGEKPHDQSEFEEINLNNSLMCIWSTGASPSWIFVEDNEEKFVILRRGEDIDRILAIFTELEYKPKQAKSAEIEDSVIQGLKEKINKCEEGGIALSLEEFNLAAYVVIGKLIYDKISSYEFEIEGRQSTPLRLHDEEYDKLAAYITSLADGLVLDERVKFEETLITAMRLPGMNLLLEESFLQKLCGVLSKGGDRPHTAPERLQLRSRSQSFSLPNSPRLGERQLVSLLNSPRVSRKTLCQDSCQKKSPEKAVTGSPVKSEQEPFVPSPLRIKSRSIPVDAILSFVWQRFKRNSGLVYEKWKALSLGYKIMAAMALTIGVGAIIYGCIFCPPIVVLVPFVGVLNAPAIAVIGGAIIGGIASVAHAFHLAFTKVNCSKAGGEENFAVSQYMKRAEVLPVESPLAVPGSQSVLANYHRQRVGEIGVRKIAPPPVHSMLPAVTAAGASPAAPAAGVSITKSSSDFFLHRRGSPALCDSSLVGCGSPGDMTVHIGQQHRRGSQSFSGSGTPPASRDVLEGVPCGQITLLNL